MVPAVAADRRLRYGPDALHFGDLFLPPTGGPHPVAVVIHGGCWLSLADLGYMSHLSRELARAGWAVWCPEYRRIDQPGGAWPGLLTDVGRALDHVRELARDHPLDAGRVVVVGHSAGGHLALWLAARPELPAGGPDVSALRGDRPLRPRAVVGLAAIADLDTYARLPGDPCGEAIVTRLLGAGPEERPERLALTSPAERLPLGVPQLLLSGEHDHIVPPEHGRAYVGRARAAGDVEAVAETLPGAGHFELVAPWSAPFGAVRDRIETFLR